MVGECSACGVEMPEGRPYSLCAECNEGNSRQWIWTSSGSKGTGVVVLPADEAHQRGEKGEFRDQRRN